MKKATGSGNFFRKFYSYAVNMKKKFSNFSVFIIRIRIRMFVRAHVYAMTERDRQEDIRIRFRRAGERG